MTNRVSKIEPNYIGLTHISQYIDNFHPNVCVAFQKRSFEIRVQSYQQHMVRKFFCFLAKFYVFRKFLQIVHVVLLSKIYTTNYQKDA